MRTKKVRIYDNGDRSIDRYTAVYMFDPQDNGLYGARGMSSRPTHPQGVGMYCTAAPGRHLGKRITLEDLPVECRNLIESDLKDEA